MPKKVNLIGQKFGKLTVVKEGVPIKSGKRNRKVWVCECECGNTRDVQQDILKRGKTTECLECKEAGYVSQTPEYEAWCNMKGRCNNPNHPEYPNYGGRGIKVCNEFNNSFNAFYKEVGPRPKTGYWCLDRIDNEGSYVPGNLRWALKSLSDVNTRIQSNNTLGHKNIYPDNRPGRKPFQVEIKRNGVKHRLGGFDTLEEAIEARDAKIAELGY